MLEGEHAAGLAQPGGDLVEDQKHATGIAGRAHGFPEPWRRHDGDGAHGFGDDSGHVAFALEHVIHHLRTSQITDLRSRVAIGAMIAMERGHMLGPSHQRPRYMRAERGLASDRGRAEPRAVERIPETHRLEAPGRRAGQS